MIAPAACAPSIDVGSAEDMLNQLATEHAPSCTDAPWRMLGLSFAGWNVLASALLFLLGAASALIAWRDAYGTRIRAAVRPLSQAAE